MSISMTAVITEQEKSSLCNADDKYLASEKSIFDQQTLELLDFNKSYESILMMINQLLQESRLAYRNVNMKITGDFIQQRISEFSEAVDKVLKSIKDIAGIEGTLGLGEMGLCLGIGLSQIFVSQWAQIAASFRDSAIGIGVHATGAWWKQVPQSESEIGNKEKSLNDVTHQWEQIAREAYKQASELFARLTEMMTNFLRDAQNIIGLQRMNG